MSEQGINDLTDLESSLLALKGSKNDFAFLLETGAMAHYRVGNQRCVYLRDVLEFAPTSIQFLIEHRALHGDDP